MFYIDEEVELPSYDGHNVYEIKDGDTFLSVAEKLGFTAVELRSHHNMYCPLEDLIEKDFKNHLKFLILPPNQEDTVLLEEDSKPKKVNFREGTFIIPFRPVYADNKYKVKSTFVNGNKERTIESEFSIKWIRTDNNGVSFFEINKTAYLQIDNELIDAKTDELAMIANNFLYPLQIVIDHKGKWIDIYEYDLIKERWNIKKNEISEKFKGGDVLKYLDAIEQALKSKKSLFNMLNNDWFLKVFFNGIYINYNAELEILADNSMMLLPNKYLLINKLKHSVSEYLNDKNLIVIDQKGILCDEEQEEIGTYKANYLLHPNNYMIEKVIVESNFSFEMSKTITVEIKNCNDRKVITAQSPQNIFVEEFKKKKGLFGRFF